MGGRLAQKLVKGSFFRGVAVQGRAELACRQACMMGLKGRGLVGSSPRGWGTIWMCLCGWLAPDWFPQLKKASPPAGMACTQAVCGCQPGSLCEAGMLALERVW